MKTEFFMNNLPDEIKKIIEACLLRGDLPCSGDFNNLYFSVPNWDKNQWKNWAKNNGINLPDIFKKKD